MESRRERLRRDKDIFRHLTAIYGPAAFLRETPIYERDTQLTTYNVGDIDLDRDLYSKKNESTLDVNEAALDNFIKKILVNQAVALGEGDEIYDDYENNIIFSSERPDGTPRKPLSAYSDNKYFKQRHKPPTKKEKAKMTADDYFKESVARDLPNGAEVKLVDGEAMVSLPSDVLRQYIRNDVEMRTKQVHHHYKEQWETVSRERMARLAELYRVRETCKQLEEELRVTKLKLRQYQGKVDDLGSKVDVVKAAKKRRRRAKKMKKNGTPSEQDGEAGGDNNAHVTDI